MSDIISSSSVNFTALVTSYSLYDFHQNLFYLSPEPAFRKPAGFVNYNDLYDKLIDLLQVCYSCLNFIERIIFCELFKM